MCRKWNKRFYYTWIINYIYYTYIFNWILGKAESKFLKKDISLQNVNVSLMEENVVEIKSLIMINAEVGLKVWKTIKVIIWNPAICSCENNKYLASSIDNSVIPCYEITEETKTTPTNFD